jgi:hypothetical protein
MMKPKPESSNNTGDDAWLFDIEYVSPFVPAPAGIQVKKPQFQFRHWVPLARGRTEELE